jgi:hypothetical protein
MGCIKKFFRDVNIYLAPQGDGNYRSFPVSTENITARQHLPRPARGWKLSLQYNLSEIRPEGQKVNIYLAPQGDGNTRQISQRRLLTFSVNIYLAPQGDGNRQHGREHHKLRIHVNIYLAPQGDGNNLSTYLVLA